jgi:hypothetical protein
MGTNTVVLLILTVICWLVLGADLSTVVGVKAYGDQDIFLGLRWILAGVLVVAVWLWLGGLLLIAGGQGILPKWVNVAALILVPASAASALAALNLVFETDSRWQLAIPLAIPPLIAAYVFSLYQPSLRTAIANPAVWGVVLVLSAGVWPGFARRQQEKSERRVEHERGLSVWAQKEKERKHSENVAKLKTMSPDDHLVKWYGLLDPEGGVREEALAALRTHERRQGDVEEGLTYGVQAVMRLVPELDLKPTPELCQAARSYLKVAAKGLHIRNRDPYPYEAQDSIDGSFPAIRWFTAHGCNCDEGITALETVARTYLDSPDRQKLLTALAGLKQIP